MSEIFQHEKEVELKVRKRKIKTISANRPNRYGSNKKTPIVLMYKDKVLQEFPRIKDAAEAFGVNYELMHYLVQDVKKTNQLLHFEKKKNLPPNYKDNKKYSK